MTYGFARRVGVTVVATLSFAAATWVVGTAATAANPVAIPMGTTVNYSVLGASTVTNTGLSVLDKSVGLSPVWIILSIILFSELFGILGTFIAVPVAAMLRVLKIHFLPPPATAEEIHPEPA